MNKILRQNKSDRIASKIKSKRDKKNEMLCRDEEASIYEKLISDYQHRVEIKTCLEKLNPKKDELILDAGCGTGRFTRQILKRGSKVVGIDYSMKSLEICKKHFHNYGLKPLIIKGDICDLPLKSGIFDKILSTGVLEHIPTHEDRMKALSEMKRVINANGKLVITTYNYDFVNRLFRNKEGYHAGRIYYYNYNHPEFKKILSFMFDKVEICGILNFVKYHDFLKNRLGFLYHLLNKMGFFNLTGWLDVILEKTFISYMMGRFLCAIIIMNGGVSKK